MIYLDIGTNIVKLLKLEKTQNSQQSFIFADCFPTFYGANIRKLK